MILSKGKRQRDSVHYSVVLFAIQGEQTEAALIYIKRRANILDVLTLNWDILVCHM